MENEILNNEVITEAVDAVEDVVETEAINKLGFWKTTGIIGGALTTVAGGYIVIKHVVIPAIKKAKEKKAKAGAESENTTDNTETTEK